MSNTWEIIRTYFRDVNGTGMYYGLFAVAFIILLYMAYFDKEEMLREAGRRFLIAVTMITVLLLCPLSVWFFLREISWSYGYGQFMRMLPMLPFVAFAAVAAAEHVFESHRGVIIYPLAVILAVSLTGSILPYATQLSYEDVFETNEDRVKQKELSYIADAILEYEVSENLRLKEEYKARLESEMLRDEEITCETWSPLIAGDNEVVEFMRSYTGDLRMLYGRDIWSVHVNREIPFEGTYRYADGLRNLYFRIHALSTFTEDLSTEDTVSLQNAYGETEERTAGELAAMIHTAMETGEGNILILPAGAGDRDDVYASLWAHIWLKTDHYRVYLY